jgi:hypothetical protein
MFLRKSILDRTNHEREYFMQLLPFVWALFALDVADWRRRSRITACEKPLHESFNIFRCSMYSGKSHKMRQELGR